MRQFCLFLFIVSTSIVNSQAEVYRWTDSEGNIQVTETPPPVGAQAEGTAVETLEMAKPAEEEVSEPTENKPVENPDAQKNAEGNSDSTEGNEPPQSEAEKLLAAKQENCKKAQERMQTLTSKAALLTKSEDGKDVLMNDEMRDSAVKETQVYVDMYCGSGEPQQ